MKSYDVTVIGGGIVGITSAFFLANTVSYTHLRAHETREDRGCRVVG